MKMRRRLHSASGCAREGRARELTRKKDLLDGKVVELHHGGARELLVEARDDGNVLHDHAGGGKHGDAAVLDFLFAEVVEAFVIFTFFEEAERIP